MKVVSRTSPAWNLKSFGASTWGREEGEGLDGGVLVLSHAAADKILMMLLF